MSDSTIRKFRIVRPAVTDGQFYNLEACRMWGGTNRINDIRDSTIENYLPSHDSELKTNGYWILKLIKLI